MRTLNLIEQKLYMIQIDIYYNEVIIILHMLFSMRHTFYLFIIIMKYVGSKKSFMSTIHHSVKPYYLISLIYFFYNYYLTKKIENTLKISSFAEYSSLVLTYSYVFVPAWCSFTISIYLTSSYYYCPIECFNLDYILFLTCIFKNGVSHAVNT